MRCNAAAITIEHLTKRAVQVAICRIEDHSATVSVRPRVSRRVAAGERAEEAVRVCIRAPRLCKGALNALIVEPGDHRAVGSDIQSVAVGERPAFTQAAVGPGGGGAGKAGHGVIRIVMPVERQWHTEVRNANVASRRASRRHWRR